ncbi:MAG: phosphate acyltransferase, partial [Myxococcota bacterium]|nr:phosphate acyltransferase [Myxococcota bacterium]
VFHDDQHGTALISAAALLNACEVTDRSMDEITVVFSGAGAAAIACARLYVSLGVRRENIWMCDSKGLIFKDRPGLYAEKAAFAQDHGEATLAEVLPGKDVFIGLSIGGVLSAEMVATMATRPIVFAMANPDPEITYDDAKAAVPDAIVATGRSDYPNQVNNVLGFPFVFRGALDCRARAITKEMLVAAVRSLAALAKEDVPDSVLKAYGLEQLTFGPDYLIPKPFDPRVLLWVAPAVAEAAAQSGVAGLPLEDMEAYRDSLERFLERSREVIRPMIHRARVHPRRIVFPDGPHPRVLRAAQIMVDEGICQPVLVGEEWKIVQRAENQRVSLEGVEIVEIHDDERLDHYAQQLWAHRQRKGSTLQACRQALRNRTVYGLMMLREGEADGLCGGLATPYAATVRPAIKVLGSLPGVGCVSGVYVMLFKNRRIFFGDCTVNVHPDVETLAHIAVNTARVAQTFGETPRVAMLSYSDFGEGRDDPTVSSVRKAVDRVHEIWPDLAVDGEMQADTAVNPELAQADFPFSPIAGQANVLVFPDLASGNIAYKLLKELGGATALGPVLVGLSRPVNALALGSSVADIVNMSAITVNQVIDAEQANR